jgi:hypothetical protein
MIKSIFHFVCVSVILMLPAFAAAATFNGLKSNPRVFNDFSTSNLTLNNSNSIPGTVSIDDRNLTDDGTGGNFANRHDVTLSTDNGANSHVFSITEGFTIQANVTLSAGTTTPGTPRKEAGFRINSPITGDTLFLLNSDAHEIVAFGGGAAFHSFGSGATGYTPGTTILMGLTYTPGAPGTIEYFNDRGSGIETSGPLAYSNIEGGPLNYTVAMYGQITPQDANDFITATFNNVTASSVPEPASLALLSLGSLAMLARRRA